MGAKQKTKKRKHLKPWEKPAWQKARKKAKKAKRQPFDKTYWTGLKVHGSNAETFGPFVEPTSPGQYYSNWEKWQSEQYAQAYKYDRDGLSLVPYDPEEAIQTTIDFSPRKEGALTLKAMLEMVQLLKAADIKAPETYIVHPVYMDLAEGYALNAAKMLDEIISKEEDASENGNPTNAKT